MEERRRVKRRDFSLYMSVLDERTGKTLGTLSDISVGGFKLESKRPLPLHLNVRLRIEHTNEISNKEHIIFTAQSIWCEVDRYEPNCYNVGFRLMEITPKDHDIFVQMFYSYGSKVNDLVRGRPDYLLN
ncbi:MAG: PilZ domain-containing protein [Anaerolineales bacterium]|nr:PilZ domain-containing protein [Anaerolineales bacterium]